MNGHIRITNAGGSGFPAIAGWRRTPPLQSAPLLARSRARRPAPLQGGARAARRRGRARVASRALPRRGRRGTLGLVDFDVVDLTNLQRQILHGTRDVGRSKLDSARERIADVNPHVRVECVRDPAHLGQRAPDRARTSTSWSTAPTTSPPAIWSTIPACCLAGRMCMAASSGSKARRRCSRPPTVRAIAASIREPPPPGLVPSCAEGGVLGVLPGLVGTIQATETLKLILGQGTQPCGPAAAGRRVTRPDPIGERAPEPAVSRRAARGNSASSSTTTQFCSAPARAIDRRDDRRIRRDRRRASCWRASPRATRSRYSTCASRTSAPSRIIDGRRHIPLGTLGEAIGTLDPATEIVVFCQSGIRSADAVRTPARRRFHEGLEPRRGHRSLDRGR